jgi:hypothetical protein
VAFLIRPRLSGPSILETLRPLRLANCPIREPPLLPVICWAAAGPAPQITGCDQAGGYLAPPGVLIALPRRLMRLGNALTAMSAIHAPKTEPQRKKRTCTKKCSAGVRLANHSGSLVKSSWLAKIVKTTAREARAMTRSQRYLLFTTLLSSINGTLPVGARRAVGGQVRVRPVPTAPSKLRRAVDLTASRTRERHTPKYGWVAIRVFPCIHLLLAISSPGVARTGVALLCI